VKTVKFTNPEKETEIGEMCVQRKSPTRLRSEGKSFGSVNSRNDLANGR
jgi:hypothetical protein